MTTNDVSVVGLYILDVLGRAIDALPPRPSTVFIDEIRLTVAGTAGGTAVDCAKLGLKTLAVGAVGTDGNGDWVLETMHRVGIDIGGMQRIDGVPTSATILPIRSNGDRPAFHVRGASDHFTLTPETERRALEARFVHVGGTGLLRSFDGEPTRKFLAACKQAGRTTIFDLIAATAETLSLVEPLLPYIDYFIPSIEEASAMAGLDVAEDIARFYLDRGVNTCVLTMGAEGSFIAGCDGTRIRLPAFRVPVADTTGCGDAYSAGFIAGLSLSFDLEQTGRLATAAAGLVATGLGSDAGIVSLERTLDAMDRLPVRA